MDVMGMAAIVTGGASGLGEATAAALAEAGAKVTVLDLKAAEAARVGKAIGGLGLACDITDAAQTEACFAAARDAHGPARILVNCAGVATGARIISREGPASLEAFARTVTINLVGTFNTMRLAAWDMHTLAPLADNERGIIINTTSIAALEGQIGQGAYASSKAGVAALTLPSARELAKFGIRVMCIAPGLFATPMMFGLPPEVQESLGNKTPFPQRLGKPGEFAHLALAMIGNVMLNGEVVRLDGAVRLEPK